ncbi:MAG TPA: glycoside hydrolase family 3 protein, partial [Terriglobales bacterium]|nr:glycoside hydrolase family 3 protein [Terriglobales bacterium]
MKSDSAVRVACLFLLIATGGVNSRSGSQTAQPPQPRPWMNPALTPDERARLVLSELTLDEKIGLLHGQGFPGWAPPGPNAHLSNGGAGFVLGVPRLGIPMIQMSDAAYGVRSSAENGRYSTALPSNLALAASWDPQLACDYGALIGRELRAQGYNMSLAGGINLAREPRNGRTFEYAGEDPILAGTMVGERIRCEQAQHVIGDTKHFALNDQESGRNLLNVIVGERAMRETDLLAFEIAIAIGHPGAVMCSYNAVNGDYACENKHLLTDILKRDWQFPGFVLSDWGGTHSTAKASAAGLDHEEPLDLFYGARLKEAVQAGQVPISEVDDHARRVLRSEFASGIIDDPVQKSVVDVEAGFATARRVAEQSSVLLKNQRNLLPLDRSRIHSIAVIGEHADTGMISGGGSAQVDPPGVRPPKWKEHVWFPTSPLKALRVQAPAASIRFDSGQDPVSAAALAKQSDVAIMFAHQWTSEDYDLPSLSLPGNQDLLIEQVAAANPRTIVVLETGSVVTMPWLDKVSAVLEVWYAGTKGADAVARIIFGDVNPSGKLPLTFPRREADLPHPIQATPPRMNTVETFIDPSKAKPLFSVNYDEGLKVGYKWFDAENKQPLFPFGFGLSYTTFAYSDMKVTDSGRSVSF